jgi:hypothetical protein
MAMAREGLLTPSGRSRHGDGFGRRTPLEHADALRSRNARGAIPRRGAGSVGAECAFPACRPRRPDGRTWRGARAADIRPVTR